MPMFPSRRCLAAVTAVGAAAVCVAGCMGPEQQTFLDRTNAVRSFWHEQPLADNQILDDKAQSLADAMASRHQLFHSDLTANLDGLPWTRLGENVGEQSMPSSDPDGAIFQAFVNSSVHFANMVQAGFSQMGVGVARSADGTVFVAEDFAQLAG